MIAAYFNQQTNQTLGLELIYASKNANSNVFLGRYSRELLMPLCILEPKKVYHSHPGNWKPEL